MPIVIKPVEIREGVTVDCFYSIKPVSHERRDLTLNQFMKDSAYFKFPISVNLEPHIRGVVLDITPEFLFWHPIRSNMVENHYDTGAFRFHCNNDLALISAVHPMSFYKNLIERVWKGKRCQRKATYIDSREMPFTIVPYHEFNPAQPQVTVYPASVFPGKLNLPCILRGNEFTGVPQILGAGYFYYPRPDSNHSSAYYWPFSHEQHRNARDSLIARLGKITSAQ